MELFRVEKSFYDNGLYVIEINHKDFNILSPRREEDKFIGSFNLLAARVMGLSYANYLRMCRDVYNAILTGKNEKYPIAHFKRNEAERLTRLLNERINLVRKVRLNNGYTI